MRRIRNNPAATGGLTPRRCGPIPRRSETLEEITGGLYVDAPWPPRVLDGKMDKKQLDQVAKKLPQRETPRTRRLDREAKIKIIRKIWATHKSI